MKQITVRVEDGVYEVLVGMARADVRSLSQFVALHLSGLARGSSKPALAGIVAGNTYPEMEPSGIPDPKATATPAAPRASVQSAGPINPAFRTPPIVPASALPSRGERAPLSRQPVRGKVEKLPALVGREEEDAFEKVVDEGEQEFPAEEFGDE